MSIRLREETKDAHTRAERAPLFVAVFRETCPAAAMTALLRGLLPAYQAMEEALEAHSEHSLVGAFHRPELYRSAALVSDLADLSDAAEPVPSGLIYAKHIQGLSEREPLLLIAHAYTRYLGDLSGGQMLGKKAHAIVGQDLAFYAFPEIKNPGAAKTAFRKRLDDLELTAEQANALVAEASVAFDYNTAIAEEAWTGGARHTG
ncbi:MAG: heme oxygenase [Myxococcota bacterium]|jgi:heme oxygenase